MKTPAPHRFWTAGYSLCCAVAGAGIGWILAGIGLVKWSDDGLDDDIVLLGLPIGAVLGWLGGRATQQRTALHRVLLPTGFGVAVTTAVAGLYFFTKANAMRGSGPFAGLGEVVVGVVLVIVAAIGVVLGFAGVCARLAARSDRE